MILETKNVADKNSVFLLTSLWWVRTIAIYKNPSISVSDDRRLQSIQNSTFQFQLWLIIIILLLLNAYTCQLPRLRCESHACGLKTSISRRLTLAGQFLTPDWKMWVVAVLLDTISKNMLTQTHVRNENHV